MKKALLILAIAALFGSCKKKTTEPTPIVAKTSVDTNYFYSSAVCVGTMGLSSYEVNGHNFTNYTTNLQNVWFGSDRIKTGDVITVSRYVTSTDTLKLFLKTTTGNDNIIGNEVARNVSNTLCIISYTVQ